MKKSYETPEITVRKFSLSGDILLEDSPETSLPSENFGAYSLKPGGDAMPINGLGPGFGWEN